MAKKRTKRAIKKTSNKIPKVPPGASKPRAAPTDTVQGAGRGGQIERGFRPPGGPQTMRRREKRLMGRPL